VAALWVVVFHIRSATGGPLWPGFDLIARSGSTGVSLFLVLSGLCLYLPYAAGRESRFESKPFFRKRLRRLLPAYYASLAVVLVATVAFGGRFGVPAMSGSELAAQALTHVTMTHQMVPGHFYGLNGGYWSLGLEWQLYLTLPLLILAAVRFGIWRTVLAVFLVTAAYRLTVFVVIQQGLVDPDSLLATAVLPNQFLGRWSEFALGMLAAYLLRKHQLRVTWQLLLGAVACGAIALALPDNPLNHMLYGVVFFTLVVVVLAGDNPVARAFAWRPLVALGVMSYSLYLVHQPVIGVLHHLVDPAGTGDPRQIFLRLVALFPVMLLVALALFALAERWTMTPPGAPRPSLRALILPARVHHAAPAALLHPAPAVVPTGSGTP
jgi:peptidoglycan/LPS O-acetylase OafA/YrhL